MSSSTLTHVDMHISILTCVVWATFVSGNVPIPQGCESFNNLINGGQPLVSIIGRRDLNRPIRGLIDSLALVQTSILQTSRGIIPAVQEITSTCRISSSSPSLTDLEFLLAVSQQSDVQACYLCDDLQSDQGHCPHIGFCGYSTVCFRGFNRDFYAGYEKNSTLNTYLYPAAVSHGCCNPAHDPRCTTGVTTLLHTTNYTVQTCNGFLCNADNPSQNKHILDFIAASTTTAATTTDTTATWLSWGPWECQMIHGVCLETRVRNCSQDVRCTTGQDYDTRQCTTCHVCDDNLDCSSTDMQQLFCGNTTIARMFCRKSCHKCDEEPLAPPTNQCGDYVHRENTCQFLNVETCICSDQELRPLCKNYCNNKCADYPLQNWSMCSSDILVGKRKLKMKRLAELLLSQQ